MGQGEAHDIGLGEHGQRLGRPGGIGDPAVFLEGRTGRVHVLGPRGDELGGELTQRGECQPVVLDGLGRTGRGMFELSGELESLLLDLGELAEVDGLEPEKDIVVVREKVGHSLILNLKETQWGRRANRPILLFRPESW